MKKYKEIEINISTLELDRVTDLLWTVEPYGIEEVSETVVKLFFPPEYDSTELTSFLTQLKNENMLESFSMVETILEEKNWNAEWESSINVIQVSDRFVIRPTFREYIPKGDEIVLTIDPKMSFGTGEHETTKLMIRAIEKFCSPNDVVLDIGTGTGVLAIAAVKLGAKSAIAFDNDDWCLENGIENCELNAVTNIVEIRTADVADIPETDFDLVLANIQKNPLLSLASQIVKKIKLNGILILSGLLNEDEEDILKEYLKLGLEKIETNSMNEWISIVFNKNS